MKNEPAERHQAVVAEVCAEVNREQFVKVRAAKAEYERDKRKTAKVKTSQPEQPHAQ